MKWTYVIVQKTKVAMALGMVIVLVIATNMMDKNYFTELGNSFSEVYEDRLLAESYIYKLSGHLYKKKVLIDNISEREIAEIPIIMHPHNDSIQALIINYEKTKLTEAESLIFKIFKEEIESLMAFELDHKNFSFTETDAASFKSSLDQKYDNLTKNLDKLSEIQLAEGKNLIDNSRRIIADSNITTQMEVCLLIVLGVIIQALIFASQSIVPKSSQNSSLN